MNLLLQGSDALPMYQFQKQGANTFGIDWVYCIQENKQCKTERQYIRLVQNEVI